MKKNLWGPKLGPKLGFSPKVCIISVPCYAQDCKLGQCLTYSRAEISKKKKKKIVAQIRAEMIVVEIGVEMIFSVLMLSDVQSNLLVLIGIFVINICLYLYLCFSCKLLCLHINLNQKTKNKTKQTKK